MAMYFDEVRQIILGNTLGEEIDMSKYHNDFIVESDGVLTGREQLLFLLDELKEYYVPKVEMKQAEADIILGYLEDDSFFNLLSRIGSVGGFRDRHNLFLDLSEEDLMQVWLYPESIKVVE